MTDLNYRHLRAFHEVAREGALNRAAARLNVSQSALSAQIKTLEERLGHRLFDRVGRSLVLTEVGRIALDHADRIFGAGEELLASLQGTGATPPPLRVGAISTLSRNFQLRFLKPLLCHPEAAVTLRSGHDDGLLDALKTLALDVVLTTHPPTGTGDPTTFTVHPIAEQPVHAHGTPRRLRHRSLRALLQHEPLIVPNDSAIRTGFEGLVARLGVTPNIAAEVDDMAMLRLLAREDFGVAIAPSVVFADELNAGLLAEAPFNLGIDERFFAVTVRRQFPHPWLEELLGTSTRDNRSSTLTEDHEPIEKPSA